MSASPLPRRRTLLLGFLAALLPLLVLLGLQYVWLSRLAKTTAIAHRASLRHFVEAVESDVRHFYYSAAERALTLPASVLTGGDLMHEAAQYWASKPVEGVHRLFLVDYTHEIYGNFYVFDEELEEMRVPYASDESLAMIAACNPWQTIRFWGGRDEAALPISDERNPDFRIVLQPVTDETGNILGVAGMILDADYFRRDLLPRTIGNLSKNFFEDEVGEYFTVTVRDDGGNVAYTTASAEKRGGDSTTFAPASARAGARGMDEVSTKFSFVFAGWTVGLNSLGHSPEEVARQTFLYDMTLAAMLALALVGGLGMALRAANRAVQLSEMKADFVSNVSHELRTPVSSIRVFGEFLKGGRASDSDTVRRYGRHIEAEGRRLSRLIDNVLDFSKIESGHKEYEFVEAGLEDVVETVVETFQVRLRDSGFDVTYTPAAEGMPTLRMDPDAIGQVLHNLLDNAVKYSGDSKRVDVSLELRPTHVVCSVKDHGIGIPRGEQNRIFHRFHRVGNSLVHDVKGSGLGLSIVQHVVEAHGGEVRVESEPGKGTTVHVRLPRTDTNGPART